MSSITFNDRDKKTLYEIVKLYNKLYKVKASNRTVVMAALAILKTRLEVESED